MLVMPTLFVSHGSPMLAIEDSPARRFLLALGKNLPQPKAILVASAHWETAGKPHASLTAQPETIHDFGGFPDSLYEIIYPASGSPDVAERAAQLLETANIPVMRSQNRGLDHGAWVPLSLMYPGANIPVTQVSLMRNGSTEAHMMIGEALSSLREEGVLIIGSGSLTHNLYELRQDRLNAPVPTWVSDFATWMEAALREKRTEDLLDYRNRAPNAAHNHPTEEHLFPLFVAMGAAGAGAQAKRIHASFEHGVLAMDDYLFSD
jgi:4,5-DOPA dioxygenase extradiol